MFLESTIIELMVCRKMEKLYHDIKDIYDEVAIKNQVTEDDYNKIKTLSRKIEGLKGFDAFFRMFSFIHVNEDTYSNMCKTLEDNSQIIRNRLINNC